MPIRTMSFHKFSFSGGGLLGIRLSKNIQFRKVWRNLNWNYKVKKKEIKRNEATIVIYVVQITLVYTFNYSDLVGILFALDIYRIGVYLNTKPSSTGWIINLKEIQYKKGNQSSLKR